MTQMNTRLEIASRLMAGALAGPERPAIDDLREDCLKEADALIAEEARTRPPAPADLRAVAEELFTAGEQAVAFGDFRGSQESCDAESALDAAVERARAMGLEGGK